MTKKAVSTDILLANIIKGIEEVKGNDIDILDLRAVSYTHLDVYKRQLNYNAKEFA